jgi:hypothetical protein
MSTRDRRLLNPRGHKTNERGYETVTITPNSGTAWVERLGFRLVGNELYEACTAGFD